MKKLVKLSFVFILLLGCDKPIKTFSYSSYALGTNFNVLYNSYDPVANFDKLSDSIFDALNKSMSTYIRESDISKINSGDSLVKVDKNFIKVFKKSKSIWKSTNGYFDPTIGLLTNAYGLGPNTVPNFSINVDSILAFTGFEKVNINKGLVDIKKGMFLDFNAIAKGYAVDLISELLIKNGIQNYLIDIGGEMFASGINTVSNSKWRVGISDPLKPENSKQKIYLKNKALASSGNYRKYLIDPISGNKIVHTINPLNGSAKQTNVLATSVLANDSMTADAYATAFMAMPIEESKKIMKKEMELEGMIVYVDAFNEIKTFYTPGFSELIFYKQE
ncbi:MAG: FAD:protein FMN transferase [Flavobacteriaceae bacterium]|nr:FAD:protein FMN transferase [Flavobacteriaceae bacterium]